MKNKRFQTLSGGRGGWTEWQVPTMKGHRMKCCDCGLVHELQFMAVAETKQRKSRFEIVALPWPIRVSYRVRRERSA
jgi:hypothetical protein